MICDMNPVAAKLINACEQLLCEVKSIDDLTVRSIAAEAGTTASAVSYYFGSQEQLIIATATRVYKRLNAERLSLLNAAIQATAPDPPRIDDLVAALIAPSVRWSLDPSSRYPVLSHLTAMAQLSSKPELYRQILEGIEHYSMFMPHFRAVAPWLTDAEIGWRISCALGIRSQVTRNGLRNEVLTGRSIDFSDANVVINHIVAVVSPMFRQP
ncbi:TetR/AcrR family transcriptional regulator [Escherichia coli]|nr:TetR/AcrR family transcriptional regulator [Salmonella enterica subsp. enterica serovar Virchow]EBW1603829.1 TetR/AcrR family transcriptional regulator [Salmonella enterica subsp. enterica serovar Kottbus]EBX4816805.1 TetR/AcrR family transcriptional regulator [Salmonella enterica subsp. enterica serovar Newport]EFG2885952.1 TetR/AcrR family transcriptional regulator [Escherichia coli]MIL09752.1 TetR/AcrR family transcriptional regulator [Salmonella enterica subsp. enterica serovar Enteritid